MNRLKRLNRFRRTVVAWGCSAALATSVLADQNRPVDRPAATTKKIPEAEADAAAESAAVAPEVIVVVGAAGEATYGEQFERWAAHWRSAAEEAGAVYHRIGGEATSGEAIEDPDDGGPDDRIRLQRLLARACQPAEEAATPLWLVLIGHGTFAANVAKFNLAGPDVSAGELAQWLEGCRRPLVVVNCASASGPFLQALKGPDRVVVTATQSGDEQNFARFGRFLAEAIGDPAADLDHDNAVSILEAFLAAAAGTRAFYRAEGRLATEHALLDDNGDGVGTPPEFFSGTRVIKRPQSDQAVDGGRARYRALVARDQPPLSRQARTRRDALEGQLETLRMRKTELSEDAYYEALETIAIELAKLYEEPVGSKPKVEPNAASSR
ncbi:hypothetical protein [Roseimaritima sediminicola]|uniref:hypothetical protein n=1 Tax=Roseimaritima sediminicola TaxID=2662066 RepID=UPI00192A52A1|nr:hypothetical protein [Roseimaritima sediminicola]